MAHSTEVREHPYPRTEPHAGGQALAGLGRRLKTIIVRCVFWSYERGSWQYDVIVLAILAFIFLSPRAWFDDRPTLQMTDLRHRQGIVEMSHGKEGWRYLVDARLVESLTPLKPDDAIHEILRSRFDKPFTVKSIVPVKDKHNVVLGYTVVVTQ